MIDEIVDLRAFPLGLDPNTCDDLRRFPEGVGCPLTFRRTAPTMSEPSDEEDKLRGRLTSMSASQRRRLRDAFDGVHSDADWFAKQKLHYHDPRTVGIYAFVTEILAIN